MQYATYREPLLTEKQNHGVPVFSPMCSPSFAAALRQSESVEDIRWGVPKVPPVDRDRSALPAHPNVLQFDDRSTATRFSTDPTYAQRAVAPGHRLPQDDAMSPLAIYHKLKALELTALSTFRSEQAQRQRAAYIKPRDVAW